jgi:hypothetical protein
MVVGGRGGGQSVAAAASSLMAVRAEESSTMVLSAAQAAAGGAADGVGDQVMLRASRFPRFSRSRTAMPGSVRLAAMRRMGCSDDEQGLQAVAPTCRRITVGG